jgi:hypothetical protein
MPDTALRHAPPLPVREEYELAAKFFPRMNMHCGSFAGIANGSQGQFYGTSVGVAENALLPFTAHIYTDSRLNPCYLSGCCIELRFGMAYNWDLGDDAACNDGGVPVLGTDDCSDNRCWIDRDFAVSKLLNVAPTSLGRTLGRGVGGPTSSRFAREQRFELLRERLDVRWACWAGTLTGDDSLHAIGGAMGSNRDTAAQSRGDFDRHHVHAMAALSALSTHEYCAVRDVAASRAQPRATVLRDLARQEQTTHLDSSVRARSSQLARASTTSAPCAVTSRSSTGMTTYTLPSMSRSFGVADNAVLVESVNVVPSE